MTTFIISALLLVGASGEGNGLSFQAQVGYVPALLVRGKDYSVYYDMSFMLSDLLADKFYFPHAFYGKVGTSIGSGWEIRAIGSLTFWRMPFSNSNIHLQLYDPDTKEPWLSSQANWRSNEITLGGEVGHSLRYRWGDGGVYFGLEGIWGWFSGESIFYQYNHETRKNDFLTLSITSKSLGLQGHVGVAIPIVSFGCFSFQINPMLKGGFLKEQSSIIPDDAVWLGPSTLSKWGIALGINLNYDGGKKQ